MNRLQTQIRMVGGCVLAASFLTAALSVAPAQASVLQDETKPETVKPEIVKAPLKASLKASMGRVVFDGEITEPKPLTIPVTASVGCCPDGENVNTDDYSLLVSKDGGIKNVVATVKVKGVKVEIPKEPYIMDQKGCRFIPHMLVVPKGATVAFLNSDETAHNVHLIPIANEDMNQTVTAGKRVERKFTEAEPVKVKCDMHTWMNSFVYVADATHWAKTDADGHFSFKDLPAGTHEVHFWHEKLGKSKGTLVVGEDGKIAEPLEVKLAPKKVKKRSRRR